jgi:hypothetical protein
VRGCGRSQRSTRVPHEDDLSGYAAFRGLRDVYERLQRWYVEHGHDPDGARSVGRGGYAAAEREDLQAPQRGVDAAMVGVSGGPASRLAPQVD